MRTTVLPLLPPGTGLPPTAAAQTLRDDQARVVAIGDRVE